MKLDITARHSKLTSAIDSYLNDKLSKAVKVIDSGEILGHAVLSIEKNRQIAEINLSCGKLKFRSKGESSDLYSSIDSAIEKLEKQIRKRKDILKDNRKEKLSVIGNKKSSLYKHEDVFDEDEDIGDISEVRVVEVKHIKTSQAIENMRLSKSDMYMFYNIDKDKICALYKNKNSLILIEPE